MQKRHSHCARKTRSVLVIAVLLLMTINGTSPAQEGSRFILAVHGGAGTWQNASPDDVRTIESALRRALTTGREILAAGGTSLDAVERTVRILEDSPYFNAGKGATWNQAGRHELDASIMDGKDRSAGAVAGITVAKNPISAARLVMTHTPHVLLAGAGADEFARQAGAEIVDPDYFWTDQTRQRWQAAKQSRLPDLRDDHFGTVGCVALDQSGNLAAGTSTGGLTDKRVGRIGDSPIIGAGTYADNSTCAVSCTGVGELFIRHAIAYDISARVQHARQTLTDAVNYQIDERLEPGTAGIIALDGQGMVVMHFNTRAMPRGVVDQRGRIEVHVLDDEPRN